jgi:hypothetical protein
VNRIFYMLCPCGREFVGDGDQMAVKAEALAHRDTCESAIQRKQGGWINVRN